MVERMDEEGKTPTPFKPLPGYRAMLKLSNSWTAAHFRECVSVTNTFPAMVEYVLRRLNIDLENFHHSINWTTVGRVRGTHKIHRIVCTSKMMFRWMALDAIGISATSPLTSIRAVEPATRRLSISFDAHMRIRKEAQLFERSAKSNEVPSYFVTIILVTIKVVLEGVASLELNPQKHSRVLSTSPKELGCTTW